MSLQSGVLKGPLVFLYLLFCIGLVWLAPDRPVDPWGLLNLEALASLFMAFGVIQVLSGLLMSWFGARRGRVLSGALSGFVSSTAYTTRAARLSRQDPSQALSRVAGTLAANLGMLIQGMALLVFVDSRLLPLMGPVFLGMAVVSVCWIFVFHQRSKEAGEQVALPERALMLRLKTQVGLTLFIAALLAVVGAGKHWFGTAGIQVLTALTGLFEVHGAMVANAELFRSGALSEGEVGVLILLGLTMAHLSKAILAFSLGDRLFFRWILLSMTSLVLSGWLILPLS